MRIFILLLLSLPLTAFAEEASYDSKFKELKKELKELEFKARKETGFTAYPNDKYMEQFNAIHKAQMEKEFALRKEFCKTEGEAPCLDAKKTEEMKAQYRIYVGLENRKNAWAKEKLTEEEVAAKEKAFTKCHLEEKDCDKLPEADRKIASEEVVEKKEEKKSEKKEIKKEEVKEEKKEESKTEKKEESTDDSEVKIEIPEGEKVAAKPGRRGPQGKGDKKEVTVATKSDEKKDEKKEEKKESTEKADAKKEDSKKEEPEVVEEEGDDEKTPRNYKPETCRWVNDLPRKVVNGPGCGPKQRSKMCTGYVICEQKQGGAKFIRMSTCSADKCGSSDEDAVRCTKDMGYFSMRPQGETKLFMTPALKKVLSNGATRQ